MINKIYASSKKFIKENYKAIIFLVCFYLFMNVKLPYYIWVSGGTISLDEQDRIVVEDAYKDKGSFNLAYVTEINATIPTFILSYIIPSWDLVPVGDYQYNEDETIEEIYLRSRIDLEQANQAAIAVAYASANKGFEIKDTNYYVYYVDPRANNEIKVGDEVISINGVHMRENPELKNTLEGKSVGDKVVVEVKRSGITYKYETEVYEEEGQLYVGIMVSTVLDYETDPSIKLNFKESESGPSGGLTLSLAIYNKLVEEDITNGNKIVGTGTIDLSGNVGEIGGVKYKLKGAVTSGADIFIVPAGSNYEECIKLKEKHNYDIEIIGVSTFQEALEKLEKVAD